MTYSSVEVTSGAGYAKPPQIKLHKSGYILCSFIRKRRHWCARYCSIPKKEPSQTPLAASALALLDTLEQDRNQK